MKTFLLLCNLIGVLSLDVGVEIAFRSRRIVTERTFMGSLSRVREEVCLNSTLPIAPISTVLPRTPVLLLVGVRGLVSCEFLFLREPCLTTIHIARIGLHPRVPIVVIFESTTVSKSLAEMLRIFVLPSISYFSAYIHLMIHNGSK